MHFRDLGIFTPTGDIMRSIFIFKSLICGGASALVLLLAGCGSPDDATGAQQACEPNPEAPSGVGRTQGLNFEDEIGLLRKRPGRWNGLMMTNGLFFNKGSYTGWRNGVELQGLQLNGFSWHNGLELQGMQLNGMMHNGAGLDGPGNALVGVATDGSLVGGKALEGLTLEGILKSGETIELVLGGYEPKGDVALYSLTYEGQSVCPAGEKGMFLAGNWDETGARHDARKVGAHTLDVSFSCQSGVLAKCATWGYAPWKVGEDLHQTCTRMARADYCGGGIPFTKDGTLIEVYGAGEPKGDDASLLFEAGWGPDGAVCVNRPRYDGQLTDGTPVMPSCWSALPRCTSLTEAEGKGAKLVNASRIQSRTFCN